MKHVKDIDLYLRATKSTEEYISDKSKAGTIGGSVGRNTPEHNRRLAVSMHLSRMKKPARRVALCLADCDFYERGKKYTITIAEDTYISAPYPHRFNSKYEFASTFKLYRIK